MSKYWYNVINENSLFVIYYNKYNYSNKNIFVIGSVTKSVSLAVGSSTDSTLTAKSRLRAPSEHTVGGGGASSVTSTVSAGSKGFCIKHLCTELKIDGAGSACQLVHDLTNVPKQDLLSVIKHIKNPRLADAAKAAILLRG